MVRRKKTDRVQLPLRMREALRAQLERASKARDVSINQEAVERLERSFATEEDFGGPEVYPFARLMAHAFLAGGRLKARLTGHPEWTPKEWVPDQACFDAALEAGIRVLLHFHPNAPAVRRDHFVAEWFAETAAKFKGAR